MSNQEKTTKPKNPARDRFLILLTILIFGTAIGIMIPWDLEQIRAWLQSYPAILSGLVFVVLYSGLTSLIWFGPKDILRIVGALLFGGLLSSVWVMIGEMINAFVLFHISRRLGKDYVRDKLGYDQMNKMEKMEDRTSFLTIMALRINMLFPFRFLDLGYGMTNVSFWKYFGAILIASPLRVLLIQYFIAVLGEAILDDKKLLSRLLADIIGNPQGVAGFVMKYQTLFNLIIIYLGALVVMTVIALIGRLIRGTRERKRARRIKVVSADRNAER